MKKEERQFLYKKYRKLGYEHEESAKKVSDFVKKLSKLKEKMKSQKKSDKDINKKFKEEFEKLCMRMEAERFNRR
jgi:hypothetical protein